MEEGFTKVDGCCKCGHPIWIANWSYAHMRRVGRSFWCPVCGAIQSWAESDLAKANAKIDRLTEGVSYYRGTAERAERSVAALKGMITKLKKGKR